MLKKTLIIIGIIVAAITLGVTALYIAKRQGGEEAKRQKEVTTTAKKPETDTSDWKVYRNEVYGFEIKYPSDWKILEDYGQVVTNIDFFGSMPDLPQGTEDHFLIQIYELGETLNLKEWVKNFYPEAAKEVTIEDTIINGYPAVIAHVPVEWTITGGNAFILRNGYVFVFPIPNERNKAIFSTFKFIK
jgi:hypothetical protein